MLSSKVASSIEKSNVYFRPIADIRTFRQHAFVSKGQGVHYLNIGLLAVVFAASFWLVPQQIMLATSNRLGRSGLMTPRTK